MLKVARQFLTGKRKRSDLVTLERPQLAYVAIAIMLASGYKLLSDNRRVDGALNNAIDYLVLKGIRFEKPKRRDAAYYSHEVVKAALDLELYRPATRGGSRLLVLDPSPALLELVAEVRGNPAIQTFLKDVDVSIKQMEEEDRNQQIKNDVEQLVDKFMTDYGIPGLEILHAYVETRLNKRR